MFSLHENQIPSPTDILVGNTFQHQEVPIDSTYIYIYIYGSGLGYTWNNSLLQGSSHYSMAFDWINILKIPLLDYTIFLFSTCMPKICDFWMLFYYLIPKLMFCIYFKYKKLEIKLLFFFFKSYDL